MFSKSSGTLRRDRLQCNPFSMPLIPKHIISWAESCSLCPSRGSDTLTVSWDHGNAPTPVAATRPKLKLTWNGTWRLMRRMSIYESHNFVHLKAVTTERTGRSIYAAMWSGSIHLIEQENSFVPSAPPDSTTRSTWMPIFGIMWKKK